MEFVVPNVGVKTLVNLTSSDMYKIFMFSEPYTCRSVNYWQSKFDNVNIDFNKWFACMFMNTMIPRKSVDFNWKIFHGQVNTENKLKAMHFSTGVCVLCKCQEENLEHLLIDCEQVYKAWQEVEYTLRYIADVTETYFEFTRFNMMVGYLKSGYQYEIMNVILSITRWIIWKRRCIEKYEKSKISLYEMISWIKREIYGHIDILLLTDRVKNRDILYGIIANLN